MAEAEPSAPSPFLPDTTVQYAWDSTSLGLFKTCPRLYQYTILEGWSSRDENTHLLFGAEYHSALEHFDHCLANGMDREAAVQDTVSKLVSRVWDWRPDPSTKAGRYKNRDSLVGLVVDYLDYFNPDPASTYIKSDGGPAVELTFGFDIDYSPEHDSSQLYKLCGHLDRVVSYDGQLYVMDRKTTTSTLGPYYFANFNPSNQMSLYTFAGRVVLDTQIRGVIIDAAQIKLEEPNVFTRGFTYRTEAQLDEWQSDLRLTLDLAEHYALDGHYPQNDTSCDRFGGCRFRSICSKDPHVRPNFLRSEFNQLPPKDRWNALKVRGPNWSKK